MIRAIQRHRDVYQDYERELKRTKVRMCHLGLGTELSCVVYIQANVKKALDKANLLNGVRNDIECATRYLLNIGRMLISFCRLPAHTNPQQQIHYSPSEAGSTIPTE